MRALARRLLLAGIVSLSLLACAGTQPDDLGVSDAGRLGPCPASPNCVSSEAEDDAHRVEPLRLAAPAARAWRVAQEEVAALPGARIVEQTPDYLRAECSSALFGFVDDLELQLRADEGVIALRSASRVGHGDMGVNRGRVDTLRAALAQRGVLAR